MLHANADVDHVHNGWTALKVASDRGHVGCVVALLEANAVVDLEPLEYAPRPHMTALKVASYAGHAHCVRALIEANATIDTEGNTALMLASSMGHVECAVELLKAGADANGLDEDGKTPLMNASMENNVELVTALLEADADVTVEGDDNEDLCTALSLAVEHDSIDCLRAVLEKTEYDHMHVHHALEHAVHLDDLACVPALLDKIDYDDTTVPALLGLAAKKRRVNVFKLLHETFPVQNLAMAMYRLCLASTYFQPRYPMLLVPGVILRHHLIKDVQGIFVTFLRNR